MYTPVPRQDAESAAQVLEVLHVFLGTVHFIVDVAKSVFDVVQLSYHTSTTTSLQTAAYVDEIIHPIYVSDPSYYRRIPFGSNWRPTYVSGLSR